MYSDHFEHRLMLILLSHMTDDQHDEIRDIIAPHSGLSECFESLVEESLNTRISLKDNAESDWQLSAESANILFVNLLRQYVDRKQKKHRKEKGVKITIGDIYTIVSNHAKWYRMIEDGGRGNYHDDIRRTCFVLELNFLEATELLYSAGHPLNRKSKRDKVIADCLCSRIYSEHEVNQKLIDARQEPLFIL